jgi:type I restriction enzyme, S subunit
MSEWKSCELGLIPANWKIKSVDDLIAEEIIEKPLDGNHGGIHPKGSDFVEAGIPFIMASDVNNGKVDLIKCKFITKAQADKLQKGFSKTGDVLLTHKASLGRTALVPNIGTPYIMLTPQVTYYRIKNKMKFSNFFLKYYFDSPSFQGILHNHGSSGSTRAYIGITAQRDLPVLFPPLPEQKSIAEVLSSLDDKIDLLHRQNKTLEQMAETLFRQWFVEDAEDDWEVVSIGDFVKTNAISITKEYQFEKIRYLDTGSLNEGEIDFLQNYVLKDAPSRAKRIVKHNDVLISTVRPNQKHYGIVKHPEKDIIVSTGFCVITCEKIDPHFVYIYLTQNDMTEYLHSIAEGSTSTYPSLKPSDIEKLEFKMPPKEKLKVFSDFADNAWEKINNNHKLIRNIENIRDVLLPKLMKGEVKVIVDD